MGGMLKAIDNGFPQKEIAESAYCFQRQVEQGERIIVGVNKYADNLTSTPIPTLKISPDIERDQRQRLADFRRARNQTAVETSLSSLHEACQTGLNIMPILLDGVGEGITLGEVSDVFREIFGVYRDPGMI